VTEIQDQHALRCTTRIGSRPGLISIVHRWHRSIGRQSLTTCPPLCWRHSSIWILFTTDQLQSSMSACIDDVAGWIASNRLQLNASKTEIMWCSSVRCQSQRPTSQVRLCNDLVTPSTVVRDLGIYLDSDVSMCSQVARTVSNCFSYSDDWEVSVVRLLAPSSSPS